MHNVEEKILAYMAKMGMLEKIRGKRVYVGVSGGADSMVLIHFLYTQASSLSITPVVIHVNHGIRGESADLDASCVEVYCRHKGIGCYIFNAKNDVRVKIPEHASEEWARNLRYNYFNEALNMNRTNVEGVIATAHTISDQCETVLFRLARGTGLKGLTGIHPIRDNFIRPLLGITRSEVEELADYYKLSYCTDETNLTDIYNRNKLRHTVMPVLKEINRNAEGALSTACERLSEAQGFIEATRDSILSEACIVPNHCYSTPKILSQHLFMQDQLIIWLLERALKQSGDLREGLIVAARDILRALPTTSTADVSSEKIFGVVQVSSDVSLSISNKYICIVTKAMERYKEILELEEMKLGDERVFNSASLPLTLTVMTYTEFLLECRDKRQLPFYCSLSKAKDFLDSVSNYGPNSIFKPAKRMGHRVRDFAKEAKVPYADRAFLPVIYDVFGNIVYTYGLGFTDGWVPEDAGLVVKVSGISFE